MNDGLQQTMVWDSGQDRRNVVTMFAISALCHVVFFVLITVMPTSFSSSYRLAPRAISVDLVSLPPGPPAAAVPAPVTPPADTEPEPEIAPPAPAPAEAVALPTPKPEPVPIAPKPKAQKVVKSLKKKTIKKETVEKTVVQKPTPSAASKSRARDVSKAIEAMRQKVQTQEKTRANSGAGTTTGAGTGGGGGGGGSAVLSRIENYKMDAALEVAQNWAFSQQLAGADGQLETLITFRILPDGEITDIKIVQPSGNRYLDESAYRAVRKASPVAPFPEGITQPYIEVGLRATPSGFR
jgi:colicin import membrane protein